MSRLVSSMRIVHDPRWYLGRGAADVIRTPYHMGVSPRASIAILGNAAILLVDSPHIQRIGPHPFPRCLGDAPQHSPFYGAK